METRNSHYSPEPYERAFDGWVYACMRSDLSEGKVALTFPGHRILITMDDVRPDKIIAMSNTCLHRGAQIVGGSEHIWFGKSDLVCPYHRWTYSEQGVLRAGLGMSAACKGLELRRYPVEVIGDFVFVDLSDRHEEFKTGGGIDLALLQITKAMGDRIGRDTRHFSCNWQICVENTLESTHIGPVHPETFGKIKMRPTVRAYAYSESYRVASASSYMHVPFAESSKRPDFARHHTSGGFEHWYIYPNLSIGSVDGMTFYVGSIVPRGEAKTEFHYSMYKAHCLDPKSQMICDFIAASMPEFTGKTLDEDVAICEMVQRGWHHRNRGEDLLTEQDIRIEWFRKALPPQE